MRHIFINILNDNALSINVYVEYDNAWNMNSI